MSEAVCREDAVSWPGRVRPAFFTSSLLTFRPPLDTGLCEANCVRVLKVAGAYLPTPDGEDELDRFIERLCEEDGVPRRPWSDP